MVVPMVIRQFDEQILIMVTSYVLTMLLCAVSLCHIATMGERSAIRASFALTQSVTIMWLLFAIRERVSLSLAEILVNIRISLICQSFIAPLWLITILLYTGAATKKSRRLIAAILSIPTLISVPLLFPKDSGLFGYYMKDIRFDDGMRVLYQTWGPLEPATLLYASFCMLACFFVFIFYIGKMNTIKPIEKSAALLVMWSPMIAHFAGLRLNVQFDLTPLAFSLWGVITLYLSARRQFFNVMPALVWNVFNETSEGMAVFNSDGAVNVNASFIAAFGPRYDDFIRFADGHLAGLTGLIGQKADFDSYEAEINGVYYEISMKNIRGRRNKSLGRLLTIRDVTATKKLAQAEERARIASGLHDSLGNRLIASINYLQMASSQRTTEDAEPYINSAATCSVSSLMTLRKIVEGLKPVDFKKSRFSPLLESVVNRISATGANARAQISGDPDSLPSNIKEFLYNSCQEALTNSVIHGKAKNILVKLSITGDMLSLSITDDGMGCAYIARNNGLTAMENNSKALGGTVSFRSSLSEGFGVHVDIPLTAAA